jgi:hypothetical protein
MDGLPTSCLNMLQRFLEAYPSHDNCARIDAAIEERIGKFLSPSVSRENLYRRFPVRLFDRIEVHKNFVYVEDRDDLIRLVLRDIRDSLCYINMLTLEADRHGAWSVRAIRSQCVICFGSAVAHDGGPCAICDGTGWDTRLE